MKNYMIVKAEPGNPNSNYYYIVYDKATPVGDEVTSELPAGASWTYVAVDGDDIRHMIDGWHVGQRRQAAIEDDGTSSEE